MVAARVPGVAATTDVQLFREHSRQPGAPRWQRVAFDAQERARITLERWQWPELLAVSVIEGDSAAASPDGDAGSALPDGSGGAAVPLVPEVC